MQNMQKMKKMQNVQNMYNMQNIQNMPNMDVQKSKISESESSINSRTCLGHLVLLYYFFSRIFFAQSRISGLCLSMGSATSAPAMSPNRTSSSLYFSQFSPKSLEPWLVPLFLNRYVEHDTLIWEYLNSSIHLVSFHLDFEIF